MTVKQGRPTIFTPELGTEICQRLAEGESLRSICSDAKIPTRGTVLRWVLDGEHKEFSLQYARARELQAETMADEIQDIADDGHNDWMERQYGDSTAWVANKEAMGRSRLRIDARKWVAAHLLPKKYSDKVINELTGPGGSALAVQFVVKGG